MTEPLRSRLIITGAGLVLFFAVGIRQGFGLFLVPVTLVPVALVPMTGAGLSREAFSFAVALQYLVWGIVSPLAARAAWFLGHERLLALGGVIYACGFVMASVVAGPFAFTFGAGILIGVGLGFTSYGLVNEVVATETPSQSRGRALGAVNAIAALGQLALLGFTYYTLSSVGWRQAFLWHAAAVLVVVPIALAMGRLRHGASRVSRPLPAEGIDRATAIQLAMLCLGFGISGLQVMFTMTHLPAALRNEGLTTRDATLMLVVLSFASFAGSYVLGRAMDRYEKKKVLCLVYAMRALGAAGFPFLPPSVPVLVVYFLVLGFFWMGTIPVVGSLIAELVGPSRLGLYFGYAFLSHQIGGFIGTWAGGIVSARTGSYDVMFFLVAALCLVAVLSTWDLRRPGRQRS